MSLVWFVVVCSFVGFRAFHGLFRIFVLKFFVESLILAQDERWRRA